MAESFPIVRPIIKPFCNSGQKVWVVNDPTGEEGRASYERGFPPETMIKKAFGGTPPWGTDFNGLFNDITGHLVRAQLGGGSYFWSDDVAAAGGYPFHARLKKYDTSLPYDLVSTQGDNSYNFTTDESQIGLNKPWALAMGLDWWVSGFNYDRAGLYVIDPEDSMIYVSMQPSVGKQPRLHNGRTNYWLNLYSWILVVTTPKTAQSFFVREDGDDSNDGMDDTPESAFRTAQGALEGIMGVQNTSPYEIYIQFTTDGDFGPVDFDCSTVSSKAVYFIGGANNVRITGKGSDNDGTRQAAVSIRGGTVYWRNLKAEYTSDHELGGLTASVMHIQNGATVYWEGSNTYTMITGDTPAAERHGIWTQGGQLHMRGTQEIAGSLTAAVFQASDNGVCNTQTFDQLTITITNVSGARQFINCNNYGMFNRYINITFNSGTVTANKIGQKYYVGPFCRINTKGWGDSGMGTAYFPGFNEGYEEKYGLYE